MRRLPARPVFLVLCLALVLAVFVSVLVGDSPVSASDVFATLTGRAPNDTVAAIVLELRLPRAVVAALVGASLGLAGCALQSLTANPLADPYLAGVASGASVGAGAAILLGAASSLGGAGLPLFAFAGAIGASALVFSLARVSGTVSLSAFLLAGVVVGSCLSAVMNLLLALAGQDQSRILGWLMGYLGDSDWRTVVFLVPPVALGTVGLLRFGRALDAISFGESTARSLGVNIERFKPIVLGLVAWLTAAAVAASGVIGFVGLVVPHIGRALIGPANRSLLPLSALLGATLLLIADTLCRFLRPGSPIPVGVVTALIGAPVFVALLRKTAAGHEGG